MWGSSSSTSGVPFVKMQTVLHNPGSVVQEVMQQLCQVNDLSESLLEHEVGTALQKCDANAALLPKVNVRTSLCCGSPDLPVLLTESSRVERVLDKGTSVCIVCDLVQHQRPETSKPH